MSESSAGAIVGTLRLNIADFEAGIAKAQALADKLDGKNVDVHVKVDDAGAEAKLAGVAASEDAVDRGNTKIGKSGNEAGKGMGALATAVIALGPALVPLAAGATGLAVGFGAMGAAGILAVVGISKEMKSGSALGMAYTGMLSTLKGDLDMLGRTAAAGVLQPFQASVKDLQTKMPALNSIIGEFSVITGKSAGALTTGLVAAFIALQPLARDAGVYIMGLSQQFAAMMSGPGVTTFGDYVRSVFPQVMAAVESIVGAAVHLVAALAPLGMGTLSMLKTFADVINALPVEVLAVLAQGATSVYIGFKSFSMLSGGITAVSTALQKVGVSAEAAAAGMRGLNIAAGIIGVLIAAATLVFSAHAESVRQNTQAANDYADAMRASNGVIDESIRAMAVKNLSDAGALTAARQLGISLSLVTDAALGNADALAKVTAAATPTNSALVDLFKSGGNATDATQKHNDAARTLTAALGGENAALKGGLQTWKDQTAAAASSAVTSTAASEAQQKVAATAGTTVTALAAATTAQRATADAAAAAAAKMFVENDAAGILKTSLDALNGKALSAAQAQNSFDTSLANMGDHVSTTGKKITFTTTSIKDMSAASVALRGQLIAQVVNLQNVAEANGGLTDSTGKALPQLKAMRQQIIDNAVAHGVDKAAVTAYVDKLLKIPKSVPPTKLDVEKAAAEAKIKTLQANINAIKQGKVPGLGADTAEAKNKIAALQRQIDELNGKTVIINTIMTTVNRIAGAGSVGGQTKATGGPITGAGTSTSDSIPVRLSNGEYVVNAAQTSKNRGLLDAINGGAAGFKDGGMYQALAAGGPLPAPPGISPTTQLNLLAKELS